MNNLPADQLLDGAAREIEARGRARHDYLNSDTGECCIFGAIFFADGGVHPRSAEGSYLLMTYDSGIGRRGHDPRLDLLKLAAGGDVHRWNAGHSTEECAALLRSCAVLERARAKPPAWIGMDAVRETITA